MTGVLACGGAVMDFVNGGQDGWQVRAGGSAWNVARVLASLGLPTAFVGTLSTDPFGDRLAQEGSGQGIDLRFTPRVDAPTAVSVIHRSHPAQYAFYAENAADSQFSGLATDAWSGAGAAYFGGITLVRDPARASFLLLAREARRRGLLTVYDPNYRPQLADAYRAVYAEYVALANLIKVSEDDLTGLMPHLTPAEGLAQLRALNPAATVLLTLGEQGARLIGPDAEVGHAGYPVHVADTVGAGDASIGGLLYATLRAPPVPPPERLAFALACAAAACTRTGAHAPTLTEILTVQKECT
ncbi:carbohydrate kinase family protein [Deinococcus humi]|uniref:Fructokinase n=1 Tax=Deinococcus humi TaxID=662880 RepID=A0A7W8JVP9_9DEIO|nr:carbohydrate kinase [Deinococcus humi]MBB5362823.1 fructokinase [Deinococcus humi]GGO26099.1 fructokinase [Deinococcus humi]